MSVTAIALLALAFIVIVGVVIISLGMFNLLSGGEGVGERIQTYALVPEENTIRRTSRRRDRFIRLRLRLNTMLSAFASDELNVKLMSANWAITPTEYFLVRLAATVIAFLIGVLVFQSVLSGIGLALIAYIIPALLLQNSIRRRRSKFERQLVDVLVLVTGAVRSGYSFLQSLDMVISEMEAPASEEFRRVRREVGLGLPLSQALTNLSDRMENDDLYLAVTAININAQVGGNLTTMLEAVTETIRERVRLFSEIRAMTAQQRYSAYLLTFLPFIMAGILFVVNPEYISRLSEVICIPIGALFNVLLGNLIITRMTKIDV